MKTNKLFIAVTVLALFSAAPSYAQNKDAAPQAVPDTLPAKDDTPAKDSKEVSSPTVPLDQNRPADRPELQSNELERVDSKREKSLPLFVGIEQTEQLVYIPTGAKFKGDFKKVTKLSIERSTDTLKFNPTKAGFATLQIFDEKDRKIYEFRLDVQRNDHAKVAQEIRSLLSDVEGITIKIINNRVVIDGQVLLPREMNRIISVVSQYGERVASSLVTLSPIAQKKIAQAIYNDINLPEVEVRAINDKFILQGTVESKAESDRCEAIAQMYVPDIVKTTGEKEGTIVALKKTFVLNLLQIKAAAPKEPGKIIQMVIHFVELNKNFEKSFKFQFTPTLQDNSGVSFTQDSRSPSGIVSTITGVVSNLLPKLNWAKQYGHARVLQSSSLLVLDGQKGDLKNTTAIPYITANQTTGQPITNFTDAGMTTSITPTILNPRSDSIRLQIDFSMKSFLGPSDSGAPMISNSAMNTVVVVRSGQSAAIGGLIANTTSTDYNKLPKTAATDPIISLFASKGFQRNQSQFVVFVTPSIKASASQGAEKIKDKFRLRD
jgi:pilus assembly protein CpaC